MEFLKNGALDPEWVNQLYQRDADASKIRAYFISGAKIKEDVKCCAETCTLETRSAVIYNSTNLKNQYEPMIFCYFCNRISHLKCKRLHLNTLSFEVTPWTCHECRLNLHNPVAQNYWKESKYETPVAERRKLFMREVAISLENDNFDAQEFESHDLEAFEGFSSELTLEEQRNRAQQEIAFARANVRREQDRAWELEKALEQEKLNSQKQIDSLAEQMKQLQNQLAAMTITSSISNHPTTSQAAKINTAAIVSGQINTSLSEFYSIREGTPPTSEQSQWRYDPLPPPRVDPQTSSGQQSDSQLNGTNFAEILSRFTACQEKIQNEQYMANRRKVMPKIAEFNGDPSKWLEFQQDVARYKLACQYDDETVKWHMRGSLKGDAFESVKDVIDIFTLDQVMEILKTDFGDPMIMVRRKGKVIKETKFCSILYRDDAVKLRQAIQGYFAACTYAKTGYINSNELGEIIYNQLNVEDKGRCKELFVRKHPGESVVICLKTIYDYLTERMPILDERPNKKCDKDDKKEEKKSKPLQLFSTSAIASNKKVDDKYKYEIRDRNSAPYIGYDLSKVNTMNRKCDICGKSNHFAVQCHQFRALSDGQKLKIINEKGICKNCILSSDHKASQCDKKLGCGFRIKNTRCQQKHHICLHNVMNNFGNGINRPRRTNTNFNTQRAHNVIQNSQSQNAANQTSNNLQIQSTSSNQPTGSQLPVYQNSVGFHAYAPRNYNLTPHNQFTGMIQVNHHSSDIPQRTVKMFKNRFVGPNGIATAYSIGDSAAEVTLVREDLREALGIKGVPELLSLQWTDYSVKECLAIKFDLEVQGVQKGAERIVLKDCYAIEDLHLPARSLDMERLKENYAYLREVEFESYFNEEPVMLIGSPHAFIIESIKGMIGGGVGNPIAIEAKLGISVYGGNLIEPSPVPISVQTISTKSIENVNDEVNEDKVSNEELHQLLNNFNSIESLGIKANETHNTENESKALEIIQEEMKELDNGSIEVPLIWNRDNKSIPKIENNFPLAFKRQLALENKLRKNPTHLKAYNDNVQEMLNLGYMRRANDVDLQTKWKNIWYLPMSLVVNANKDPPKFRNVYDASCRYNGKSLNDLLLKGPDLLIDILKPLLVMRMNKIAFTADVQHMFHRLHICVRDQQCQRVLWRADHSAPLETLILNVMAFGPTCSPFVSQYVKNWNADRFALQYSEASNTIKNLMYMDDLISSEPSVTQALQIALQCIEICKQINWNLISFQSNSIEFLKGLPGTNVKKDLIPIITNESEEYTTKVLGCNWNTVMDCFVYQLDRNIFIKMVTEFEHHPTKRDLASTIARIYDVLGLIAHFTIRGKILLQRAWKLKLDWDDEIPVDLKLEWRRWLADIENIAKLKIPRMYCGLDSLNQADKIELHIFCDAGAEAFGAVAYFAIHHNNTIETSIIMAKAKVTPLRLKTETEVREIPRLELMSALLAARLGHTISNIYNKLSIQKFYWSDSEIVLRWILNPNHRLIKYAISPIEEILANTERDQWKYVPSELNPADICTKFKKFDFADNNSIWFTGPGFLRDSTENWPQIPEKLSRDSTMAVRSICLGRLNFSSQVLPPYFVTFTDDSFIDKLSPSIKSTWSKLVRAVARALKLFMDVFIQVIITGNLKNKQVYEELKRKFNNFSTLLPDDLERAEHFIFRKIQRDSYPQEYKALAKRETLRNNEMLQLNVFMDIQGLIRINSRVNLNSIYYPQQYAPLLPKKNEIVRVLLQHYHNKYKHVAIESQIAEIRTKCWIPKLRSALKSTKAKCNYCSLKNAKPCDPLMAPLPEFRTDTSLQPFEVTGLDVFGPLEVKVNGRYKKVYILIFTCTLTRFIHLHILESLESLRVLEAIVVFWSAHGPVRKFVSDNGTNFVGAANILRQDYENTKIFLKNQQSILLPKLSEVYQVDWHFIPPGSPWMGGVYERLIQEVKRSIADTLHQRKLTKVELNIAINEASHRLNLRPLTHNSIAAEDDVILTPYHLAKHRSGWPLLPGMHKEQYVQTNDKSVYRKGRIVADEIMRNFTAHYLPVLTKRCKWFKDEPQLEIGDLVLLINPNQTRTCWKRGRIVKVYYGKDNKVRVANVQLADGSVKERCSARHLARIEINL